MSAHGSDRGFHVLRFLASLKAARDFGLEPDAAAAIATRFNPRADADHLIDALATALLERGAVHVPESA
jgi:hypothetical protein